MRLAFVVNDIATELELYTTTCLAMAAVARGHEVWYIEVGGFALDLEDRVCASARQAPEKRYRSPARFLADLRGKDARWERICVDDLDLLWLRNDPNKDVSARPWARLAAINFGRLAMRRGVIVLNDPVGLAAALTKLYLQEFPKVLRPQSLISRDKTAIKEFIKQFNSYAVLKPLYGSGGKNVFLVQPEDAPNVNQMIEAVSTDGYVIAQEYLPAAVEGDTRLFLLNGRPLVCNGCLAAIQRVRHRGDGDMRSNMSVGAVATKAHVTPAMLQIADILRPKLVRDGMFFVGLDIAGDKLMEINVMSPGGLVGAEQLEGVSFSREIIEALERKVEYARFYHRQFDNCELATL